MNAAPGGLRILILAPYPPYPPYGGGTMRIYRIVRGLAARHQVTCLTFAADRAAEQALQPLAEQCRLLIVSGPPHRSTLSRAWTTVGSTRPDMALRNASQSYADALRALLQREHFDVVQAESIEMAGYLDIAREQARGQASRLLVLDQFNAEYLLQKRAALTSLAALGQTRSIKPFIRNLAGGIYSLAQWVKLAAYERRVMQACDRVAVVSAEDAATLQRLAPRARIGVVPNGVDTSEFSIAATPALSANHPATIVFSGTLDFRPNVDAVIWFAREVWPRIQASAPNARFVVVGRRPAPALQALAEQGLLTLTGEVADARPFLRNAAVYIVPMRIGGGVRLKLLEALSLEAPVVSTSMGAEGVAGLQTGVHCMIADDPSEFARATLQLLHEPARGQQLGQAGRALVQASYDWDLIIPQLEELYR